MGDQLTLGLPAPAHRVGVAQVWILTSDGGGLSAGSRHLFVSSETGAPLAAAGDFFLVRQTADTYLLLGPEGYGPALRSAVVGRFATMLGDPGLLVRRLSGVQEALAITLAPGRYRGALPFDDHGVRSRTAFEHALFRVAARHGADRLPDALRASHLAEAAVDARVHPVVQGIFRRERGDLLTELYRRTGDIAWVSDAPRAYGLAAQAFAATGLLHQSRTAGIRADLVRRTIEQPCLPGLEEAAAQLGSHALGYTVRRACGFSIALEAPDVWAAETGGTPPFVAFGTALLNDTDVLAMLANTPSPRRRVIATAHVDQDEVTIQAGLAGEMHALLGALPGDSDQFSVTSIALECESLAFTARPRVARPNGPAVFKAQCKGSAHEITVRISMDDGEDLALRFQLSNAPGSTRSFI